MSTITFIFNRIKNLPAQPCCGYFLYGGTRVVGLLDFGFAFFTIILITSEIYQNFRRLVELYQRMEYFKYYFRAASWVGHFTFQVLIMGLSILLFRAAKKRSPRLCKIWMILSTITTISAFILFYVNHFLFKISTTIHAFGAFYIIYKPYCFYVVWSFIRELESYGGFNAALSGLTDAEVEEFERGCPPEREKEGIGLVVQNQAFDKNFEILPEDLDIDETSLLGSGAFGSVFRGKLKTESGEVKAVAVKTVNQNADVAYFKTLLTELKVMTFVSEHENIVNLIGACTENIKQKKLYIVVEFCPYGNLFDYLKARRGLYVNLVKDGVFRTDFADSGNKLGYSNITPSGTNTTNTVTTLDLLRWLYESSKGLEVLEAKKVVHGDIAARNILLGFGKTAKICDFGLSKKLYQYTTVVKEATLLPWRWMALESLSDMEFSVKSDVWSFATTIWEVFSLTRDWMERLLVSELPFPGFSWDKEFVNKVRDGLRMNQPRNATRQVYDLMLSCWKPVPKDRPSFTEVREELAKMLEDACSILRLEPNTAETKQECDGNVAVSPSDNEVEIYIPSKYSNA